MSASETKEIIEHIIKLGQFVSANRLLFEPDEIVYVFEEMMVKIHTDWAKIGHVGIFYKEGEANFSYVDIKSLRLWYKIREIFSEKMKEKINEKEKKIEKERASVAKMFKNIYDKQLITRAKKCFPSDLSIKGVSHEELVEAQRETLEEIDAEKNN